MSLESDLHAAARAVARAEAFVFAAGAGMGVDSGLPDFRGPEGFWRAYPPYARLGLDFVSVANPKWFQSDPALAWGFYGHRLGLYRKTVPHAGFAILKSWAGRAKRAAVFTSNVDGQFQRAGFDPAQFPVVEAHGAIDWLQCHARCGAGIFPADGIHVNVDESTMRAEPPLPACPECHALARPNILMFGDFDWDATRTRAQEEALYEWFADVDPSRLVLIECGAGTAVPTVRRWCETLTTRLGATLVRINVREPGVPEGQIGLPVGALAGLRAIEAILR